MPRILLDPSKSVSASLLRITADIVSLRARVDRLKAVADQITNNGAAPAALEGGQEGGVPVGQGATVYTGLGQIQTALTGLSSLVSAIDQGA